MSDVRQWQDAPPRPEGRTFALSGWRLGGWLADLRIRAGVVFEREMDAGRGFLWLPVLFGAGIVIYFVLPAEPSLSALAALTAVPIAAAARANRAAILFRFLVAVSTFAAGVTVMKLRTDLAAAPVLSREMTARVDGWVAEREAASRGGVRVLLRLHDLEGVPASRAPRNIRVTIRSGADAVSVGDAISVLARLRPPSGPVLPGGYDFARADFYAGVGAVGFAYGRAESAEIGPPPLRIRLGAPVAHLRQTIRARILSAMPGDNGQIAAALIMGDKRGISETTQEAMRASGLGHILAISGLHMALVAGSAFWLIRALLALSPRLAINRPIRKWAAGGALFIAGAYLAISGSSVATERAFIMLAVMLIAVMIDRRAITLRNVALAALIVLALEPESILSASFQMSFAATLALVAGYEAIRERADRGLAAIDLRDWGVAGRFWLSARGLFITSLIAGLATTPFAIYHFQRAAPLTLIANLAAMPVVGLIVMPMAFFSVVLMPLGLESVPLTVMGWGLDWVVLVARLTAEWSSSFGGVPAVPPMALLLTVVGFLWLALWRESWRLAGVLPIVAAVPLAFLAPRPDILVEAGGRVVAVRAADGRYRIVNLEEDRFVVEAWLRADADTRPVTDDLAEGVRCDPVGCVALAGEDTTVALSLRPAAFADDCRLSDIVISRFDLPDRCRDRATVIDGKALRAGGAHALYRNGIDEEGRAIFRVEAAYPQWRRPFMPPVRQ